MSFLHIFLGPVGLEILCQKGKNILVGGKKQDEKPDSIRKGHCHRK